VHFLSPFLGGGANFLMCSDVCLPCIDMLAVDAAAGGIIAVECITARAAQHRVGILRGRFFAPFPHLIFLGGHLSRPAPGYLAGWDGP
jgi:hypothetical protein